MDVRFDNRHVQELYIIGKSRKYPLQPSVLRKFFMRIQALEAAATIHDLWKTVSMNFKKLQGHQSRYSVRIDQTWRLEFEIEWQNEDKTVGTVTIKELSKHYGD